MNKTLYALILILIAFILFKAISTTPSTILIPCNSELGLILSKTNPILCSSPSGSIKIKSKYLPCSSETNPECLIFAPKN